MKKIIILLILLIPLKVNALVASSYIIMDTDNNRVLEGNNINRESLIASITKIMTTMVVINSSDINREITIGDEVLKSYGSGIYISVGEKITLKNLLYGLMLRSGNDAAIALAFNVGGSMEGFTILMNNLASSLKMNHTNFINSNGLEEGNKANKSTVYDMALLSSYAIQNKTYKKIVNTKKIIVKTNLKTYEWHNKNKLLKYKYCTGGKTGYTEKAKRTLVTNASKNGVNLTMVTFNDGNDFNDHKDLYEKYFKKLKKYKIISGGKIKTKYKNTYINKSFSMSLSQSELKHIKKSINYYNTNATNSVGNITIKLYGKTYFKEDIFLQKNKIVKKESFLTKVKKRLVSLW
jgi:serine-type D-Ala-D-Ala carboxypeptidase (penicillin-binding protein 5/6)